MIILTIAPGYACSVHDDKGGLQPTVESLGIPPALAAKLKVLHGKFRRKHFAPKYSGRKALEAEFRVIAEELQRSVGDRFVVEFRSWVRFDAKHWRTRWREVLLTTGKTKEFWIPDGLPDKLLRKVVRIFPDFGGAYLWDVDAGRLGNSGIEFSDALDQRFRAWADGWESCLDNKMLKIDKTKLAKARFDERGLALAVELKREIGQRIRVIYYCTLSEPALEVMSNGTTLAFPRNTDFREWVLEQARRKRKKSGPKMRKNVKSKKRLAVKQA